MNAEAYRDRRGRIIKLGEQLGAGGEGTIFSLSGRPAYCAKIYHPSKAAEREDRLRSMLAARPSWLVRRGLAWPSELLYSADARPSFAGFVMPTERGMLELYRLLVPDERLQIAGFLSARDLCVLAATIAGRILEVHRAGHCVGDLKPQNILVAPLTGRVTVVDTDSFQIRDRESGSVHPSPVVTPEYTAPELFGDPARTLRTPASDSFALAVLIHQLLLGGAHPFEGELVTGRGSVERIPGRIRHGLCALVPGVTALRPAPGALSPTILPLELRALFARCFGEGHRRPDARPDPATWRDALLAASRTMTRCKATRAHFYYSGLVRCPWCERRERTGLDLFPSGQAWQRALARSPDLTTAPERDRTRWLTQHVHGRLRAGTVTPVERAWLLKTGGALGLDHATVTRTLDDALRPQRSRLQIAPRASVIAFCGLFIASLSGVSREAQTPPCAVAPRYAKVGNTRGRGAYLRTSPSTMSAKLPIPEGTVVRLTGETRLAAPLAWSEIEVEQLGRRGWVATKYLVTLK